MAKFEDSMNLLTFLEYSNRNDKLLHKNKDENGLTFYGIYESANPLWMGWGIIKKQLAITPNIKECSIELSKNKKLVKMASEFIKINYWDKAKLDFVDSQKIADEIFIFGFHIGMTTAIKKAQKYVGVDDDGNVGKLTLSAFNSFNEHKFDIEFDEIEKDYYDDLIARKPYLKPNGDGWYVRALFAYNEIFTDDVIV